MRRFTTVIECTMSLSDEQLRQVAAAHNRVAGSVTLGDAYARYHALMAAALAEAMAERGVDGMWAMRFDTRDPTAGVAL